SGNAAIGHRLPSVARSGPFAGHVQPSWPYRACHGSLKNISTSQHRLPKSRPATCRKACAYGFWARWTTRKLRKSGLTTPVFKLTGGRGHQADQAACAIHTAIAVYSHDHRVRRCVTNCMTITTYDNGLPWILQDA